MNCPPAPTLNTSNIDIPSILSRVLMFSRLPAEVIEQFATETVIKEIPKGKVLFLHHDEADRFYIIVHGWVKLFRETLDGNEAIIDVLNDYCSFGETAIFEDSTYHYSAEAVENSIVLSIPLRILQEQIQIHHTVAMNLFGAMTRYRKQQDTELEHRDLQSAPQRIGCFLLRLCKQDTPGEVVLHLPYDKSLIAARLGMKPETFSRALNRLRKEANINIQGSAVTIQSLQQLSEYCCSACSSTFPCDDLKTG